MLKASTCGTVCWSAKDRTEIPSGKKKLPLDGIEVLFTQAGSVPGAKAAPVVLFKLSQALGKVVIPKNWLVGDGGPAAKVKTREVGVAAFRFWRAKTGIFCVTVCPKIVPKTPVSKLRPQPPRMTIVSLS